MKKHGAIRSNTGKEVANPWFKNQVEAQRKKNKAAKKARKKNR